MGEDDSSPSPEYVRPLRTWEKDQRGQDTRAVECHRSWERMSPGKGVLQLRGRWRGTAGSRDMEVIWTLAGAACGTVGTEDRRAAGSGGREKRCGIWCMGDSIVLLSTNRKGPGRGQTGGVGETGDTTWGADQEDWLLYERRGHGRGQMQGSMRKRGLQGDEGVILMVLMFSEISGQGRPLRGCEKGATRRRWRRERMQRSWGGEGALQMKQGAHFWVVGSRG